MIQKKPVGLGFQKCNNVQKSRIRQMRPNSCKQLAGVSSVKTGRPGLALSFFFLRLDESYFLLTIFYIFNCENKKKVFTNLNNFLSIEHCP